MENTVIGQFNKLVEVAFNATEESIRRAAGMELAGILNTASEIQQFRNSHPALKDRKEFISCYLPAGSRVQMLHPMEFAYLRKQHHMDVRLRASM